MKWNNNKAFSSILGRNNKQNNKSESIKSEHSSNMGEPVYNMKADSIQVKNDNDVPMSPITGYSWKWELILSEKRFRQKSPTISSDGRNPFENDYGRLISSAPIRRLQDKTQVFPLERSDYIRTRLTHSLEVSYIASSLGQSIEKVLLDNNEIKTDKIGWLSSLLRVAGLVHDMGNPPFGHFGEEAIKQFFKDFFGKGNNADGLNEQEQADFKNFDGNVQTFRIMSKLYYFGDQFSYNLTYSALSSVIKYPSGSKEGNQGKKYLEIAKRKFGYFVTEEEKYKEISEYLHLNNRRNPVAYLLEAADDIAYCAADLEDGVKLGVVRIEEIRSVLENNLKENKERVLDYFDALCKRFENEGKLKDSLIIQNFRILVQRDMISATIECFKKNYSDIMEGKLEEELLECSCASDIRDAFKQLQIIIFNSKSVLKKELAGWEAVYGLLDRFVSASVKKTFMASGNTLESRLYNIISTNYRKTYESLEPYKNDKYKRIQLVVDFISGMTDRFAIDLYQELKGIKL